MKRRTPKKQPTPSPSPQPPVGQGTLIYRKSLDAMNPDEAWLYLIQLRDRLTQKQGRERTYLDRRARRGISTPTDEVYEADQMLETELIDLLEELIQGAADLRGAP